MFNYFSVMSLPTLHRSTDEDSMQQQEHWRGKKERSRRPDDRTYGLFQNCASFFLEYDDVFRPFVGVAQISSSFLFVRTVFFLNYG